MDTKLASIKWGISSRRVRVLCANNQIPGAVLKGKSWIIPDDAEKPIDGRTVLKDLNLKQNSKYNSRDLSWIIRRHVIEMCKEGQSSHISSNMSQIDFLTALYNNVLNLNPSNPKDENRDYFIMSKGHASASLYALLAEIGFMPTADLITFDQNYSYLPGHVSKLCPGVEFSSGSLGHGLGYASGIAYALKRDHKSNKVFVLLGDGECDEGSIYEALNIASMFKLDNLYVLVDVNKMSAMGYTKDIIDLEPLDEKFKAFRFDTYRVDGHNQNRFLKALFEAFEIKDKPHVIICDTIKGWPIKRMEDDILWHYRFPHVETGEYKEILDELNKYKPEGVKDPYEK